MALCETALWAATDEAVSLLAPGGHLIVKATKGGSENELKAQMEARFREVKWVKPAASRGESNEVYLCAMYMLSE